MFVYIKTEANLWTVGHYDPSGEWVPESDHGSADKAADRVRYLNGGVVGELKGGDDPYGWGSQIRDAGDDRGKQQQSHPSSFPEW